MVETVNLATKKITSRKTLEHIEQESRESTAQGQLIEVHNLLLYMKVFR